MAIKLFASAAAADGGEQKTIIVIGSDTMYVARTEGKREGGREGWKRGACLVCYFC